MLFQIELIPYSNLVSIILSNMFLMSFPYVLALQHQFKFVLGLFYYEISDKLTILLIMDELFFA